MKLILKETKEKRSKQEKNVNAPNCPIGPRYVCLPTCAPRVFAHLRAGKPQMVVCLLARRASGQTHVHCSEQIK